MRKQYAIIFFFLFVFPMISGCLDDFSNDKITEREFDVQDGDNINSTRGCFFIIKPVKGPAVDPRRSVFYVCENGHSPYKLDTNNVRMYDDNGNPSGGDLNASYNWTSDGNEMWNKGEYIGFDMPNEYAGINIIDGNIYEVLIKNFENDEPLGVTILHDRFVYTCQGNVSIENG